MRTQKRPLAALAGSGLAALAAALVWVPAASAACPNEAVREQQEAQRLPACRAWEQVSPTEKYGYQVGSAGANLETAQLQVSPDGSRVTFANGNPIGASSSGSNAGLVVTRSETGWQDQSLLPAPGPNQLGLGLPGADAFLRGTSADQSTSAYFDSTTVPFGSLWIVRADGTRARIADASTQGFAQGAGALHGQPWFEGISQDGTHVLFGDTDALVPGVTSTGNEILYEWIDDGANGGRGTLRVVNRTSSPTLELLEGGSAASLGGSGLHEPGNLALGGVFAMRDAISADGSRIFFQTPAAEGIQPTERMPGGGPVYVRVDGASTIDVSAPSPGYTPTQAPTLYQFIDASKDGRFVFFWANGDLASGADPSGAVYRFDVDQGNLEVVGAAGLTSGLPPSGLASADGQILYFQAGNKVLERWSAGEGLRTVFGQTAVFTVGGAGGLIFYPVISDSHCVSANLSADGRYFVASVEGEGERGEPEILRYDAASEEVTRIADGAEAGFPKVASCDAVYGRPGPGRVMSEDGSRIFFSSIKQLSPEDRNHRYDPYEWTPQGLSVLTSGHADAPGDSFFMGADESGRDAYFVTEEKLAPSDGDTVYDLYTARTDGGFLFSSPSGCDGEACQGPPRSPLAASTPGSSELHGRHSAPLRLTSSKRLRGSSGSIVLSGPPGARVTASGHGVHKAAGKVGSGRTVRLKLVLDRRSKRTLSRAGRVGVTVTLTATAPDGGRDKSTLKLTFVKASR